MKDCSVVIHLDVDPRTVRTGDTVRGHAEFVANEQTECRKVAVDYLWQTAGKGTKVKTVVDSVAEQPGVLRTGVPLRVPFAFTVPACPVSYSGKIVSIVHSVRAYVDIALGKDPFAETELTVAPAQGSREAHLRALDEGMGSVHVWKPSPSRKKLLAVVVGLVAAGLAVTIAPIALPVVLIVGAVAVWRYLARAKLGSPQVSLSSTTLSPGSNADLVLDFQPRKPLLLSEITATLLCEEEAASGSGKSRQRYRETVYEERLVLASNLAADHRAPNRLECAITIPADAAMSFLATDNSVNWRVDVRVAIPSWPDWKKRLDLRVVPEC